MLGAFASCSPPMKSDRYRQHQQYCRTLRTRTATARTMAPVCPAPSGSSRRATELCARPGGPAVSLETGAVFLDRPLNKVAWMITQCSTRRKE